MSKIVLIIVLTYTCRQTYNYNNWGKIDFVFLVAAYQGKVVEWSFSCQGMWNLNSRMRFVSGHNHEMQFIMS